MASCCFKTFGRNFITLEVPLTLFTNGRFEVNKRQLHLRETAHSQLADRFLNQSSAVTADPYNRGYVLLNSFLIQSCKKGSLVISPSP